MWNSTELKKNEFILSIALFFDDFEINNPLGSRKSVHKLDIVYLSLLSLFSQYSNNLNNIFFMRLHNYQDHKKLDNKILSHIVDK